jgi:hypothetical protein
MKMDEMTKTDIDNMRTAIAILKTELFGDPADTKTLCQFFSSWEDRSSGFEAASGAILRVLANSGVDVQYLLDGLSIMAAGE